MKREVVKDRTTREVARMQWPTGEDVHQKTIRLEGHPWRRIAAFFGRDAARREFVRLLELRARGVTAPEPLDCARVPPRGIPRALILTTRTLSDYRPLRAGEEISRGFPAAWGRALARIHELGIEHRDLHRGNLMLRELAGDAFDFALLDADRVRFFSGPLPPSARRRQILLALRALRGLRERSALREFLAAYGDDYGFATRTALDLAAQRDLLRHLRSRSRRALRTNPDFEAREAEGLVWQVRSGFPIPAGATAPRSSADQLKDGGASSVWKAADRTIVKSFAKRLWSARFRVGPKSRAHLSFQRGHRLELLGVPTPRVLACADGAAGGRSLLVTEELVGALQISEYVRRCESARDIRDLARTLGSLLGRLHASRISHRDLKGRNLLRTPDGAVWIIDLEAMREGRPRRYIKDLIRFLRSAREAEAKTRPALPAFARAYALARSLDPGRGLTSLRAALHFLHGGG